MTIYKKLVEAQKGFERLIKNSKADRYKYADLPAVLDLIMPELHARNLFLHQKTSTADNYVVVETVVYDENGNSVSGGQLAMPTAGLMQKGAQAFGSALTYARRYSLTAFFCLAAEDDDGTMASRRYEPKQDYVPDADEPVMPTPKDAAIHELSQAQTMEELQSAFTMVKMWKYDNEAQMNEVIAYKDKRKEELKK